jgi:hypothetical protein
MLQAFWISLMDSIKCAWMVVLSIWVEVSLEFRSFWDKEVICEEFSLTTHFKKVMDKWRIPELKVTSEIFEFTF